MKRTIQFFILIGIVAILGDGTMLAGGFQLNEHGARAMAQGGAFAARASDPSAIYFNPAGLGFLKGINLYAGTTLIMPTVSFYGPTNLNRNDETKMVDQTFTPINFYGSYQVMDNLTVGLGVNNPYGLGTEWPSGWEGRFISDKCDLQSFYFTPTVAYKVNDQLALGVEASYVTGSVTLSRDLLLPLSDSTHPASTASSNVSLDLSGTGFGYGFGALYKITPELSVGLSYRSSVKIDASGSAKFNPNYSALGFPQGDASASITLPATGFAGVAYKVMDDLTLEADYQFIGWSSYDTLNIEFKADPTANAPSPKDYQDTYIIRVGGEYTWEKFQFRAGYLFDHSPVKDQFVDPLLPDANRNGVNVGLGYSITDQLSIDVSYMFLKFDQRKVQNTVVQLDGTYNSTASLIGIDLGYSF